MRVLELGTYIVPAYAGMLLAEQGHEVTKLTTERDPITKLHRGDELWSWINHGKVVRYDLHSASIVSRYVSDRDADLSRFDIVLDNFRPDTLKRWGIDPVALSRHFGLRWCSMRSEVGQVSFDIIAQARATMRLAPYVPFYLGDTAGGLFLAFKAVADNAPGHYQLGHASCLAKLVEGELTIDQHREPDSDAPPWDAHGTYGVTYTAEGAEARVTYKDAQYVEPVRDRDWQLANLWHVNGRITI